MTTCAECGRKLKGLICRDCQRARARRGMLQHQRRFLQTWLEGTLDLRVKRADGVLHLELFDNRWQAYCGADMFFVTQREFVRELPIDICPACLAVFDELGAAAKAENK